MREISKWAIPFAVSSAIVLCGAHNFTSSQSISVTPCPRYPIFCPAFICVSIQFSNLLCVCVCSVPVNFALRYHISESYNLLVIVGNYCIRGPIFEATGEQRVLHLIIHLLYCVCARMYLMHTYVRASCECCVCMYFRLKLPVFCLHFSSSFCEYKISFFSGIVAQLWLPWELFMTIFSTLLI